MIFDPKHFNISDESWNNATRFSTDEKKIVLQSIIRENYPVIKDHFNDKRGSLVSDRDLDDICVANLWHWIRIHEFGQMPSGKNMTEVLQSNRKDFDHYNKEIVVKLLRERHPEAYSPQCQFLLNMTAKELRDYVDWQEMMYNK